MRAIASGALTIALSLVTSHAMGAAYGTAGCGLGSIAIGPKPGMMQIVAATLNSTGGQTFAITTGTSNCAGGGGGGDEDGDKKGKDKKPKGKKTGSVQEQKDFVANNLTTLKREAAQGGGDSLAALAETLGCEVKVYPKFAKQLQTRHGQIFTSDDAMTVLVNIHAQVASAPALSDGCDVSANDLAQAH